MDEAGTSGARDEKTNIVAAVIVHADNEILSAEALLNEALTSVPEEFRDGFIFHAEDIMNNPKYRERWRLTDRANLLKDVMSIPKRLRLPIALGQTWAWAPPLDSDKKRLAPNVGRHLASFMNCVHKADQFMRESADPLEIATIVAENHDHSRLFTSILRAMRAKPLTYRPGELRDRKIDVEQGFNSQTGAMKVTRIRQTVHWVGKEDDPLVWIADAVAYGLKRYFAELPFGEEFGFAVHDGSLEPEDFKGPASGGLLRARGR